MQLNMLEAMNIYVNVVEQGSFIRAAEVLELHRPAVPPVLPMRWEPRVSLLVRCLLGQKKAVCRSQ